LKGERPEGFEYTNATKKSRGRCGYSRCRKSVFKNAVFVGGKVFHTRCAIRAAKAGEI